MFSLDDRLKGLPALKEQVVSLHQSLNQPHLAIPGRKAGESMAYVVGLRGPSGFAVFVYLYLPSSGECAVYVPSSGAVPPDRYAQEEADALGFVESMGFIMDNLNFRGRPADEQDAYMKTLPVFQREAPTQYHGSSSSSSARQPAATGKAQSLTTLGKLFSAFCLALLGCAHVPTDREKEQAQIRYDLALQTMLKEPQTAFKEIEQALTFNPAYADAWHVRGILMHNAFGRQEEAMLNYQKALQFKPGLSECHTNLGNLYADMKRFDDAIREYDVALTDVLYTSPYIAHGNKGWALYRKGDIKQALESLRLAVAANPKYCMGHRQLGIVYEEQGSLDDAAKYFGRYREHCPEYADAHEREGLVLAKLGKPEQAKKALEQCVEKSVDDVKERCQKALAAVGK